MNTLEQLNKYIEKGWYLFPLLQNSKYPKYKGGFHNASNNFEDIKKWYEENPKYNWGLYPGKSNLCVIDIDISKGANPLAFGELQKTLAVKTAHGLHLYYQKPKDIKIGNDHSNLPVFWDIRCDSGYVVIPPSIHPDTRQPYEWIDESINIIPLPEIILEKLIKKPKINIETDWNEEEKYTLIVNALSALKKERADDYENWKDVGMIIKTTLGDKGLPLWDTWSKQSSKYYDKPGECAKKWESFHDEYREGDLTLGSLLHWAEIDSQGKYIRPCPRDAKPSDYISALHTMGYFFTMNNMNDRVYINGNLLSDGMESMLLTRLRENSYKNESYAKDAWKAEAYENQFHPIREYLNNLKWDGQDHINKLCSYFPDKDNIFSLLLRKWLIGAVKKILGNRKGEQNPMLVLDGKQGIGKSRFVWWLGSVLPDFYKVSAINPEDKDYWIDSISHFVWEVEELGSTIRKADREALKAFISRELVTVRVPYGHYEIKKPVTCSYIGTLNDEGGFLTDPTGNRRFRVCTINKIDWNYSKDIDVNQVWAQAVALYKSGESSNLSREENELMNGINSRYEIDDPLAYYIEKYFDIEPDNKIYFTPTAEIISTLKSNGVQISDIDRQIAQRVGAILTKLGLEKTVKRVDGKLMRGWFGIIDKNSETKQMVENFFNPIEVTLPN